MYCTIYSSKMKEYKAYKNNYIALMLKGEVVD